MKIFPDGLTSGTRGAFMRKVLLFTLLATFAFTLPVSAARYHYNLESGPPTINNSPPNFPPFPAAAYSFFWESDHLVASPQCPAADDDISKLPGFSGPMLTGTGVAAYSFLDIVLVCTAQPNFLPLQIRVDWNVATPSGLCVSQPPFTLPFYALFIYSQIGPGTLNISAGNVLFPGSPESGFCLGLILYNNETVTVTDTWSTGPTPGPLCLHCRKRVSLRFVEGPVRPPLGGPVEATIQLTTLSGEPASSVRRVTLTPGRVSSVDLAPDDRQAAGTFEDVVPVVNFVDAPAIVPAVQITTESFDSRTGEPNGPLITSGISVPPSILASQSLGHGETMRLIARATSPNACMATLSFFDAAGNRIGRTASVNLPPGEAKTLDLTLDSLPTVASHRERIEIVPAVQLTRSRPAASAEQVPSVCSATAEVFNSETGVTATYQNAFLESPPSLPAHTGPGARAPR
jgi:hypothetical protein